MQDPASLKILIIDDNEASAKTLGWMMEMIGHDSKLALNGAAGLEIAREYKPDLILLDIGLPGMNGYEVCQMMRKEPSLDNTTFVAQTGWGQQEHRDRSKAAGFDHHLVKPIQLPHLEKLVQAIAHKKTLAMAS